MKWLSLLLAMVLAVGCIPPRPAPKAAAPGPAEDQVGKKSSAETTPPKANAVAPQPEAKRACEEALPGMPPDCARALGQQPHGTHEPSPKDCALLETTLWASAGIILVGLLVGGAIGVYPLFQLLGGAGGK